MKFTDTPPKFTNLIERTNYYSDEKECKEYLAHIRWAGNPVCPHKDCGGTKIYHLSNGYKCAHCAKKFSVVKGTIFEESKIPLSKWFICIYLLTSHKKGISSLALSRDLGITQKTAWFMLQRVRFAFRAKTFEAPVMTTTIEVDETYIGWGSRKEQARL